ADPRPSPALARTPRQPARPGGHRPDGARLLPCPAAATARPDRRPAPRWARRPARARGGRDPALHHGTRLRCGGRGRDRGPRPRRRVDPPAAPRPRRAGPVLSPCAALCRSATMSAVARDRFVTANGLRHHLLEWGERGPVVVLLHGFLEQAHVWDFAAPALVAAGYHVYALDWRGHGDSEWVGAGGYYHFADYTADLAFVVRALGGRAVLIGHSMGASAALIY